MLRSIYVWAQISFWIEELMAAVSEFVYSLTVKYDDICLNSKEILHNNKALFMEKKQYMADYLRIDFPQLKTINIVAAIMSNEDDKTLVPLSLLFPNEMHYVNGAPSVYRNGRCVQIVYRDSAACGSLVFMVDHSSPQTKTISVVDVGERQYICVKRDKSLRHQYIFVGKADLRQCSCCHAIEFDSHIRKCKDCKEAGISTRYCSKYCQTIHWSRHKEVCAGRLLQ